jgi:hypothetical protein
VCTFSYESVKTHAAVAAHVDLAHLGLHLSELCKTVFGHFFFLGNKKPRCCGVLRV